MTVITKGDLGSYEFAGQRRYADSESNVDADPTKSDFTPNDFVGLNQNILEEVDVSDENASLSTSTTIYNPDYIDVVDSEGMLLNAVLLSRNGPYGYTTWRQLDYHNNNKVSRAMRAGNTMSFNTKPSISEDGMGVFGEDVRFKYYECPVQKTAASVLQEVVPLKEEDDGMVEGSPVRIRSSYGNDVSLFDNESLNIRNKISSNNVNTASFNTVANLYINIGTPVEGNGSTEISNEVIYNGNPKQVVENKKSIRQQYNGINGKFKLKRLLFSETLFPKRVNMYQNKTRVRTNYTDVAGVGTNGFDRVDYNTYWRDEFTDRLRTDGTALNSMSVVQNTALPVYDGHSIHDRGNTTPDLPMDVSLSSWFLDTSMIGAATILTDGSETDRSGMYNKFNYKSENTTFSAGFSGFVSDDVRLVDGKKWKSGTSTLAVEYSKSGPSYVAVGSYIQIDMGEDVNVKYMSLWGHDAPGPSTNFPTLKVEYSDNGSIFTSAITGWIPNAQHRNVSDYINKGAHRYWRVTVTATPTTVIGGNPYALFYELEVLGEMIGCSKYSIPSSTISGHYGELGTVKKYINKDASESYYGVNYGDHYYHLYAQNPGLGYTVMGDYLPEVFSHYINNSTKFNDLSWIWDELSNFELKYNIPYQTSKKPWYDSFTDYSELINLVAKDYSILSEYNMSDFVEDYVLNGVKGRIGNTIVKDSDGQLVYGSDYISDFLKVKGSDLTTVDGEFNDRYVYSDVPKQLKDLKTRNTAVADIKGIKIKLDTVNKPIPYRGFYPVDRSTQVGSLLKESYGDIIDSLPIRFKDKVTANMMSASSGIKNFSAANLLQYKNSVVGFNLYSGGAGASIGDYIKIDYGKPLYLNRMALNHGTITGSWTEDIHFDIEYSDDDSTYYKALKHWTMTSLMNIDYSPFFDEGAHRYWKLVVSNSDATATDTLDFNFIELFAKPYEGHNALQTFLYHIMSPGVFYNSIKSGLAVSMPAYTGAGGNFGKYDITPDNSFDADNNIKYTVEDASYSVSDRSWAGTGSIYEYETISLFTPPNYKVPFEVLLDVKSNILNNTSEDYWSDKSHYFDPQPYFNHVEATNVATPAPETIDATLSMNFSLRPNSGKTFPYFEMANHNFLSETEKFFLKDQMVQSFMSKPESEFKAMEYGTVYYMDVVLKNKNIVMTEGYMSEGQYDVDDSLYEAQFRKQRGSIYGYPISSRTAQNDTNNPAIRDLRDPHYGQWTPPYFYGDSIARISFSPQEFDTNMSPGESRKFTLDEIIKGAKIRTYNKSKIGGADSFGAFRPGWDDDIDDNNGLYNMVDYHGEYNIESMIDSGQIVNGPGGGSGSLSEGTYFNSALAFSDMMQIDSSVDLWSRRRTPKMSYDKINANPSVEDNTDVNMSEPTDASNDCWVINTKWETPILQFGGHGVDTYCTLPDSTNKSLTDVRRARGMWYDYGVLPEQKDGIFLEIRESFPERIYESKVFADKDDNPLYVGTNLPTFKTYSGQDTDFRHNDGGEFFGSLIDVCGFSVNEIKLGQVADKREVNEAVCVIPFVERDGKIEFFDVNKDMYNSQTESRFKNGYAWQLQNGEIIKDTSITQTYDRMSKFVIPPQFDYRHYSDIDPFVMYILHTKIDLSKQDLVDIWQNVMPDTFETMTKDHIELGHKLEEYEFFHSSDIPNDIRFMMFKVKQRAEWNYYNVLPSKNDDKKFKFKILDESGEYAEKEPTFSYNWPYDFISLVSNAKLDVEFDFEGR